MSTCSVCGAPLVWIRTPAGKSMPCDVQPVYIIQGDGPEKAVTNNGAVVSCEYTENPDKATGLGYVPHFATCKKPESGPHSIYTQGNPYGYRLNLRHPLVQKLYWRYKDKHHIPHWCPLSDEERLDFEAQVIEWWERRQHG